MSFRPNNMSKEYLNSYCKDDRLDLLSDYLATSIKRLIVTRECLTPQLIAQVRSSLAKIYQHFCMVDNLKKQYPPWKNLDSLLVQYVELEYEVLYRDNHTASRNEESYVESIVLDILQKMFHKVAVDNCKSNKSDDIENLMNKMILKIFTNIRSDYLQPNRFIANLIRKLMKSFTDFNLDVKGSVENALKQIFRVDLYKNLTSDYSTGDSDSDSDNHFIKTEKKCFGSEEIKEVPSPQRNTRLETIENKSSVKKCVGNVNNSEVIICSDSEDVVVPVIKKEKRQKSLKKQPVVTFEIMDDSDDDGELNYMVYLQGEAKSSSKVSPKVEKKPVMPEEIVVLDSENEEEEEKIKVEEKLEIHEEKVVETEASALEYGLMDEVNKQDDKKEEEKEKEEAEKTTTVIPTSSTNNLFDITEFMDTTTTSNNMFSIADNLSFDENFDNFLTLSENLDSTLNNSLSRYELIDPALVFRDASFTSEDGNGILSGEKSKPSESNNPVLGERLDSLNNFYDDFSLNHSFGDVLPVDDDYFSMGHQEFPALDSFLNGSDKIVDMWNDYLDNSSNSNDKNAQNSSNNSKMCSKRALSSTEPNVNTNVKNIDAKNEEKNKRHCRR